MVGAYDKVGYLTPIVRYHINRMHPNPFSDRHPTYTNRGLQRHTIAPPFPLAGARESPPKRLCDSLFIILKIKLSHVHLDPFYRVEVNNSASAQRFDCDAPTYYSYYITVSTYCQDFVHLTIYHLCSQYSQRTTLRSGVR